MGGSGTATLGPSPFRSTRIEKKPIGPVSTQLEEIVEVSETARLEILDQGRHKIIGGQWPEGDEAVFDPKLLIGKIVSLVDCGARQSGTFERGLPDENYRAIVGQL